MSASRVSASDEGRRVLVLSLVLLLGWLAWVQLRPSVHPWGDLSGGTYTDHLSHMNAARAATRVGLDLWRRGAADLFPPASPARLAAMPPDVREGGSPTGGVYVVPGWPPDKPWVTSWSGRPRLYPPGDLLLVAPVAAAYHFTGLSLAGACTWLVSLFLVATHVVLFLALAPVRREGGFAAPVLCLSVLLLYGEAVHWSLEAFYDAAAVVPLLLSARYAAERRGMASMTAFCAAAFVHFRVFFLAPLALYSAWLFVRQREWRGLRPRDGAALLAAAGCAVASLWTFLLVAPSLPRQEISNVLHVSKLSARPDTLAAALVVGALATAAFAAAEAWLDLAILAWLCLVTAFLREAYPWHVLIPMAWLAFPAASRRGGPELVRLARLVVIAFLAMNVFGNSLWPSWIGKVVHPAPAAASPEAAPGSSK